MENQAHVEKQTDYEIIIEDKYGDTLQLAKEKGDKAGMAMVRINQRGDSEVAFELDGDAKYNLIEWLKGL